MTTKIYSFLVTTFLLQGIFADPFHFHFGIQEPVVPFVGRHDFLQNLHEALTRKVVEKNVQYSSITFVTGRGGIGKTETTRKYIETYAEAFDNVIWIEAENELEVEKSFRSLAKSKIIADKVQIESESESETRANDDESKPTNEIQKTDYNIPNSEHHSQMTDKTIQNIYQTLGRENRRTLMIFDNVDKIPWRFLPRDLNKDLNEISSSASNSDVVPPSILILRKKGQSSKSKGQQQMDSVKWLPLTPFNDDDNINYILHYPNLMLDLTSDDLPEVKVIENARLLGQLLGGIPLALKQAMAFISIEFKKHPEKGLEKYLSLYKDVKIQNGANSSESESATLNPIFLTWKITKEKLSLGIQGNLTTLIMGGLPFFPSSKISIGLLFYIFSGGKEPFHDHGFQSERTILIKNAINSLHKYAIVNIDRDLNDLKEDLDLVDRTLSMHRELQKAVLNAFKKEKTQLEVEVKMIVPTKFAEVASWLLINALEFLEKVIVENKKVSLNELYSLAALFERLESALDSVVVDRVDIQTMQIIPIARFKVALRFQKLENFEGEENCRKSLRNSLVKLKQLEPDSQSILKSTEFQKDLLKIVKTTFVMQSEASKEGDQVALDRDLALKSLKLHEIVLEIATEVLGKEHPFRLACLDAKVDALWRIESPPSFRQDALAIYNMLHEVYTTLFGKKHQETILALHKLAEMYFYLDENAKCFDLFSQVFDLEAEAFGPGHPVTIQTMQNLAATLDKMGKSDEALKMSKSVLELQQATSEFVTSKGLNDLVKEGGNFQESNKRGKTKLGNGQGNSHLQNMANNYVNLNQPAEAYKIWEKLYNEDLKKRGPDDLKTVNHESEMGRTLYFMKDYSKAMKMQLHVLEIREKALGPDHSSTINTKFDLANLYVKQQNFEKALELYKLVYEFRNKTMGKENKYTLATLKKLADVHSDLNNKETAQEMKRQIYMTQKRVFGEDALETLNALSELATATSAVGQDNPETMKEVLQMFQKVYKAKKKLLGPTDDETLSALYLLTNFQARQGEQEKAMQQLESAYDFLLKSPDHGPESPFTAAILFAMSQVRTLQGKKGLALKLELQALEINRKSLGLEHPNTISSLERIASIYHAHQDFDEALKYYVEAHSIMSKLYGPDNPKTMEAYEHMGSIYLKQRKYEKASVIYTYLYEVRSKTLGEQHNNTISALFGLGAVGNGVGNYEKAFYILKEVVEAKMTSHGPLHETTIAAMEHLAITCTNLKKFEEALKNFEQVYEGQRVNLGAEHRNTMGTLQNIALCHLQLGDVDKAIQLITQVYNTRVKILGPEHPETEKALNYKTKIESEFLQKQKTEL